MSDKEQQKTFASSTGDAFGSAEQPTPLSHGIIPQQCVPPSNTDPPKASLESPGSPPIPGLI